MSLPNPITDNITRFTSQGIKRVTPSGNLKTFKDPFWPVIETFVYDIYRLTELMKDDFIQLINAAVGQEITVTDYLGAVRTGYIVTPVNEILTIRDDCWYDIHFEFMANVIANPIGQCHDSVLIGIPEPGDANFNKTIDDFSYYNIQAENEEVVQAENNEDLFIEAY